MSSEAPDAAAARADSAPGDQAASAARASAPRSKVLPRVCSRRPARLDFVFRRIALLWRLTLRLLGWLGLSLTWMWRAAQLFAFVACLLPALVRVLWFWLRSRQIVTVRYGRNARNFADIFLARPRAESSSSSTAAAAPLAPVIIFVCGGAWTIGHRGWGALMGRVFQSHRIVCVSVDYRNFPQSTSAQDMIVDVSAAIAWTLAHIHEFGGDPGRVFLAGQSAGAHLSAITLLQQIEKEFERKQAGAAASSLPPLLWSARSLRGYCGISGPFDLVSFRRHVATRGLNKSMFMAIIGSRDLLHRLSPTLLVRNTRVPFAQLDSPAASSAAAVAAGAPSRKVQATARTDALAQQRNATVWCDSEVGDLIGPQLFSLPEVRALVPPVVLFHGTCDVSCPAVFSTHFAAELRKCGVPVRLEYSPGKSHTDYILEDPLGGSDPLLEELVRFVLGEDPQFSFRPLPRLANRLAIACARFVNPF